MTQPPRSNLPPDAELWRRWVENELINTAADTARSLSTLNNSLGSINATLSQLSGQVSAISKQQAINSAAKTHYFPLGGGGISTSGTTQQVKLGDTARISIPPNCYALVTLSGGLYVSMNTSGVLMGNLATSFLSLASTSHAIVPNLEESSAFVRTSAASNGAASDLAATVTKTVRLANRSAGGATPFETDLSLYVGGYGPAGITCSHTATATSLLVQILYQESS